MAVVQRSKIQRPPPFLSVEPPEWSGRLMRYSSLVLLGITLAILPLEKSISADADDTDYAQELWSALEAGDLVNHANAEIKASSADSPHGPLTHSTTSDVTVKGHTGKVAVHAEFGDDGTTAADASADPAKHLKAVNVMFKREAGYDPATNDWFWAKYDPDGKPAKDEKGAVQVGKVVAPCTACHAEQKGQDYLFHKTK